jgi:hypothetical protein
MKRSKSRSVGSGYSRIPPRFIRATTLSLRAQRSNLTRRVMARRSRGHLERLLRPCGARNDCVGLLRRWCSSQRQVPSTFQPVSKSCPLAQ